MGRLQDQMRVQQDYAPTLPSGKIQRTHSNPSLYERKQNDHQESVNGNGYDNGNKYRQKSSIGYNDGSMYGRKDSLGDNAQMFKCKKCSKKKPKNESFIFTNCKEKCTKYCRSCTKNYFIKQFDVGKWPIKCPQCGKQECDAADFMLCDKDVAEMYQEQYKLIVAGFNEIPCPKCGEVKMLKNWDTSNRSIKCPKRFCNFAACKKCYIGWDFHNKVSCEDMKKLMTDSKHWRKCKCGKIVQNGTDKFHKSNYNHIIRCNKCKRDICYRCGETFNKDYSWHSCPKQAKTWWQSIAEYINPMSYMT